MGKDKNFSMFIKSEHVLYYFSCVVYSRLKAFGKKRENKTHRKISLLKISIFFEAILDQDTIQCLTSYQKC